MKKFLFLALITLAPGFASAQPVLVYESKDDVAKGKFSTYPKIEEGVLMPADRALKANMAPLVGEPAGELKQGSLLRLDNDLNLAIIKIGDAVADPKLSAAHQKNGQNVIRFVPSAPASPAANNGAGWMGQAVFAEPFKILVNGQPVEDGVKLKKKKDKGEITLEVVNTSSDTFWSFGVTLTSTPDIHFFKKGKEQTLRDIPSKTFEYRQQIMFNQFRNGDRQKVRIDLFFIKEKDYVWTVNVKAKDMPFEQKFDVHFEE